MPSPGATADVDAVIAVPPPKLETLDAIETLAARDEDAAPRGGRGSSDGGGKRRHAARDDDDDDAEADRAQGERPRARSNDTATRSKIVLLLGDAVRDPSTLFELGVKIERALFEAHGEDTSNGEYRARARSIAFNLAKNESLRVGALAGDIAPATIARMTPDELATEDMRNARKKMEERLTRKRTRTNMDGATETDAFACAHCRSTRCQARSVLFARARR